MESQQRVVDIIQLGTEVLFTVGTSSFREHLLKVRLLGLQGVTGVLRGLPPSTAALPVLLPEPARGTTNKTGTSNDSGQRRGVHHVPPRYWRASVTCSSRVRSASRGRVATARLASVTE